MRKKLLNTAKIKLFKLDYSKIMKELRKYAENSLKKKAEAVILIGSLAKGNYTAFSDADVVIVTKSAPKNPLKRLSKYMEPTVSIDLQLRVYTYDELKRMATEGRRIIEEIIKYGKVLAGSTCIIDELKRIGRVDGFG